MIMTTWQGVVTVLMAVLGTVVTRFLPFLLFPESKQPPRVIEYLGKVLPYAMTGLLVVYSLKGVQPLSGSHGIPEAIAIIVIVVLALGLAAILGYGKARKQMEQMQQAQQAPSSTCCSSN